MVQPNEMSGKVFNYHMDMGGPPPGALDRGIAHHSTRAVTTHLRDSHDGPAVQTWNFKYLIYRPGAITRASLTQPVLTGPMSGCLLATYTKNGQYYAAHIGTDTSPTHANTVAVKAAWTAYAGAAGVANVKVGNPFSLFSVQDIMSEASILGVPRVFGYMTPHYCYALLINNRAGAVHTNEIKKVRGMPMRDWNTHPDAW